MTSRRPRRMPRAMTRAALCGRHAQPGGNRILDMRVQATTVVDAADIRIHEPRRDERAANSGRRSPPCSASASARTANLLMA